ncbi:hypothetical protein BX616_006667, partial [Lobosporangium transversale]
ALSFIFSKEFLLEMYSTVNKDMPLEVKKMFAVEINELEGDHSLVVNFAAGKAMQKSWSR